MNVRTYEVTIKLKNIAGGFPGSVDKARAFLQAQEMRKGVPAEAREEFEQEYAESLGRQPESENGADTEPGVIKTGFRWIKQDGRNIPSLMPHQVKAMLQGATLALYSPTTRPSIYQVARAITYACEVRPDVLPMKGGQRGPDKEIHQIIAHPRNPSIRIPSIRRREIWLGGFVSFEVIVLTKGVGEVLSECLEDLFEVGGSFVGLGTDRGYGYGRFSVESFREKGETEAVLTDKEANPRRKGLGYKSPRARASS